MEDTPEFKAHVQRLFTPLKPGLAYVRTMEFVTEDFETMHDASDLSPEMLDRTRKQAIEGVSIMEAEILEQLHEDARQYIEEGGGAPGWNAVNVDEMQMNLAGFCDSNMGIWERVHFPQYKERNPGQLDEEGLAYVDSFMGSALAALPYHTEDGDESVYYDSDVTVPEGQEP